MGRYIIATEHLLISREEERPMPRLEGTYLTPEDAEKARKALAKKNPKLWLKVEVRTIFDDTSETMFDTPPVNNPTEAEPDEVKA